MPALILSIPFFLAAAILFCLVFWVEDTYAPWLVAPFVSLAVIYVFSPEINWWWFKRRPPDMPEPLHPLLEHNPYYQRLPPGLQLRFRQKTFMLMMGIDFKKPTDEGSIPEDIKAAIAASAAPLLMGTDDLLFPPFEHVVVYATPFPSPQYPMHMHVSEIFEEDGVALFSAQHLIQGFLQPTQHFPIGLYEYAKIFLRLREKKNLTTPAPDESAWTAIEAIAGYSRTRIAQHINLEEAEISLPAVAVVHFFLFPEGFQEQLPELYGAYCGVFQQDPLALSTLEAQYPVVKG